MLSLSTSDFQPLPLFLHPHLIPPHSGPNFHNFQLVRSRKEGKQRSRGRAKAQDSRVQRPKPRTWSGS